MSELRKDPLNNGWVIIAQERGKRPSDFGSVRNQRVGGPCVFCEGREGETPPEVLCYRADGSVRDGTGWRVRVVSNKYAAVDQNEELGPKTGGLFATLNGVGVHDVVVETPNHDDHLCDLPVAHIADVVRAYRERARMIVRDQRIRYVQVFKNWGEVAGASLEHSHSQIIALPVIPRYLSEQLAHAKRYYAVEKRCVICDIIRKERKARVRLVRENDGFVAIAPFASRFAFELHIYPKRHSFDFVDVTDPEVVHLATMLKEVLFALRLALLDPPFNLLIHTEPQMHSTTNSAHAKYHWHLVIIPRLTRVAGFEWGTGFHINPTPPERATTFLREVIVPAHLIRDGK